MNGDTTDSGNLGFRRTLGILNLVFLGLTVTAGFGGFLLQSVAFPQAGSAYDPILASVYVENLPAHVSMKASFYPGVTRDLNLTVTVTGPKNEVDPALIVVQCAASPQRPHSGSVPLSSLSTTPLPPVAQVLAISDDADVWSRRLSCYTGLTSHGQKAAAVIKDQSINLTLPVLQQNPDVQSAESGAGSPSPPNEKACFTATPPYVATTYQFPTTVATTETLENVNLADDRIDSDYPSGQIGSGAIVWQGTAGLAPSLSATNLDSAARQNKDTFLAGLLYGIAAALAVPFVQGFACALPARKNGWFH